MISHHDMSCLAGARQAGATKQLNHVHQGYSVQQVMMRAAASSVCPEDASFKDQGVQFMRRTAADMHANLPP